MYYYAVGNELNLGKWNAFVDFMYSKEEIDRKGIITSIVGRPGGHNAFDTLYEEPYSPKEHICRPSS